MIEGLTPQQRKQIYIDDMVAMFELRLTENTWTKFETCYRAPVYGWSVEDYQWMPIVADKLRAKGYTVTSSVNWEVTDWLISV